MNENSHVIRLGSFVTALEGWGTRAGAKIRQVLTGRIAALPGQGVIKLSLIGMKRFDLAFAAEAIVGVVTDQRTKRPICVVDLADEDLRANLAAAARDADVPVMVWNGAQGEALGLRPGSAAHQALVFVLERGEVRATEFAKAAGVSISNASWRFNRLWSAGLLQRVAGIASSGGLEHRYLPVG